MATKKPKDRSLSSEASSMTPMLGDLIRMNNEAYVSAQKELTAYQWDQLQKNYPTLQGLVRGETNKDRMDAIAFMANSGDEAWAAFKKGSPEVAASLENLSQMAQATGATPEITANLDQQALNELQLGRQMTDEQSRAVTQASREAAAARGQAMGVPAAVQEVLARDSFGAQMEAGRRDFAAGREAGNRQFGLAQAALADQTNPVTRILGMGSQAQAGAGQVMGFLQGVNTPDSSNIIGMGLQYGSDLNNTNFNARWSDYLGQQNMKYGQQQGQLQANAAAAAGRQSSNGAMMGAGIGAAGAIAGGLIAF